MPSPIHALLRVEGWSPATPLKPKVIEVTSLRGLLDDTSRLHAAAFEEIFGRAVAADVLTDWASGGITSTVVERVRARLLSDAFDSEDIGEAFVDFRNVQESVAPGVAPVLCSMLAHLASACGVGGSVHVELDEEGS